VGSSARRAPSLVSHFVHLVEIPREPRRIPRRFVEEPLPVSRCRFLRGLVASTLLASGCESFEKPAFNGEEGANGAPLIVIPFRSLEKQLWFGEFKRGERVANLMKDWARANASDPNILEGSDVQAIVSTARDWKSDEIRAEDWKTLCQSSGAQYLIEGAVGEIELRRPEVVGFYDASIRARIRVINLRTARLAYEGEAEARYGTQDLDRGILIDVPSSENDPKVEQLLLELLAENVGKLLFGYYAE
jgi:hypothetical protein